MLDIHQTTSLDTVVLSQLDQVRCHSDRQGLNSPLAHHLPGFWLHTVYNCPTCKFPDTAFLALLKCLAMISPDAMCGGGQAYLVLAQVTANTGFPALW